MYIQDNPIWLEVSMHLFKVLVILNSSVNFYIFRLKLHLSSRNKAFGCPLFQRFKNKRDIIQRQTTAETSVWGFNVMVEIIIDAFMVSKQTFFPDDNYLLIRNTRLNKYMLHLFKTALDLTIISHLYDNIVNLRFWKEYCMKCFPSNCFKNKMYYKIQIECSVDHYKYCFKNRSHPALRIIYTLKYRNYLNSP